MLCLVAVHVRGGPANCGILARARGMSRRIMVRETQSLGLHHVGSGPMPVHGKAARRRGCQGRARAKPTPKGFRRYLKLRKSNQARPQALDGFCQRATALHG